MDASPAKRRVLGALDPNACSPKVRTAGKAQLSPVKAKAVVGPRQMEASATSPSRSPLKDAGSRKRRSPIPASAEEVSRAGEDEAPDSEPAPKRPCLDNSMAEDILPRQAESPPSSTSTTRTTATAATRRRSASPDSPSVFDTSAADNSQATILTEPDTSSAPAPVAAPAPIPAPRPRPRLTREQTRQKAEILRLRLGLASYKVRTGQTDVPLDRLEAQHLARTSSQRPSLSRTASFSHDQTQTQQHLNNTYRGPSSVSASFPPPGVSSSSTTTGAGAGRRRPLPAAPLRRGSSSASVSTNDGEREPELGPIARAVAPGLQRILETARREQQREREEREQQRYGQYQHQHQHQHQHQRRQSEGLYTGYIATGYSGRDGGEPPRPRTATEVGEVYRRGSMVRAEDRDVDEEEDEDLEGRGGAASGLLSLARS